MGIEIASILASDANANVVVLGDFNDFEFSGSLGALKAGALQTLIETLPQAERYTYVFEGNSQTLDRILVSDALFNRPFEYDVVHVNSEFAEQSSDHEPQVVRLSFGEDFSLKFDPPTVPAQRGGSVNAVLRINRDGGFDGSVTVSAPDTGGLKIKVKPKSKSTTGESIHYKLEDKRRRSNRVAAINFCRQRLNWARADCNVDGGDRVTAKRKINYPCSIPS